MGNIIDGTESFFTQLKSLLNNISKDETQGDERRRRRRRRKKKIQKRQHHMRILKMLPTTKKKINRR
jgi:hypothetical protein